MYIFRLSYIYFFTQNSVSNLVKRTILKINVKVHLEVPDVSNLVKRTILKIGVKMPLGIVTVSNLVKRTILKISIRDIYIHVRSVT